MSHYSTIFVAAMPDEMSALTALLTATGKTFTAERDVLSTAPASIPHSSTAATTPILCVTSGIGMVNAATTLAATLKVHSCDRVICFGSAGGLSPDARVQQVVVGTEYINGGADGTAFGYIRGQVPGEPPVFTADAELLKIAQNFDKTSPSTQTDTETNLGDLQTENLQELNSAKNQTATTRALRFAPMTSSDFFVTEKNVGDVRELFPDAVTADMETQAFAQVCSKAQIPFIAVRAISDLCGNPDDQSVSFHAELSTVAKLAAEAALAIHNLASAE